MSSPPTVLIKYTTPSIVGRRGARRGESPERRRPERPPRDFFFVANLARGRRGLAGGCSSVWFLVRRTLFSSHPQVAYQTATLKNSAPLYLFPSGVRLEVQRDVVSGVLRGGPFACTAKTKRADYAPCRSITQQVASAIDNASKHSVYCPGNHLGERAVFCTCCAELLLSWLCQIGA